MPWKPQTTSVLPAFNAEGNLPPGDYEPNQSDFESQFVQIPGSTTRPQIYPKWQSLCSDLMAEGLTPDSTMLVDGSFTSSKVDPGDCDFVTEVPVMDATDLSSPTNQSVLSLLRGPQMKAAYLCDAYPLITLPESHPDFDAVTEQSRAYWSKWFGADRNNQPKGRVWRTVGGFQ